MKKAKELVNKSKEAHKVNATKLLNKTGTLKSSNSTSDVNATDDAQPVTEVLPTNSTPAPLTQEDVDKSVEDGKNIIKDQEIKEASGILETLNNTKNIEKDSETGPVVDADSITNKPNITKEAIANETASANETIVVNGTTAINEQNATVVETKDTTTVIGAPAQAGTTTVVTPAEVGAPPNANDPAPVSVPAPAPVVVVPARKKVVHPLTPKQTNPVPRASDTNGVWPAVAQVSSSLSSQNAAEPTSWDSAEVLKTFSKTPLTEEQKFEKEQTALKQKILM